MFSVYTLFFCPYCGKTWAKRVVTSARVGKEVRTCGSCHQQFLTLDYEWAHMTRGQKVEYCLSGWVAAFLLSYILLLSILLTLWFTEGKLLVIIAWLLLIGGVAFAPVVAIKVLMIRRSNARVAANAQTGWSVSSESTPPTIKR